MGRICMVFKGLVASSMGFGPRKRFSQAVTRMWESYNNIQDVFLFFFVFFWN